MAGRSLPQKGRRNDPQIDADLRRKTRGEWSVVEAGKVVRTVPCAARDGFAEVINETVGGKKGK